MEIAWRSFPCASLAKGPAAVTKFSTLGRMSRRDGTEGPDRMEIFSLHILDIGKICSTCLFFENSN